MSSKIAQDFLPWLAGSGGGCKSDRQAHQIVSRCLKFLKFCCKEDEDLTFEIVDFSLCSPNLLFQFVGMMQDEWNLGHARRIGYLDAIAELGDFRQVNGAAESVLRGLSCTELYLKKVRKTVSQDDAITMDERTRYRRLRSQGTLGHVGRALGSRRGAMLAAL